ncbi:MAG: transcription elongation factor GreA [Limnochordia bacterium]
MSEKEVLLTEEGLEKLEKELDYLKRVRRREVANRIKDALEFGDISENAEYDDAKNEQAFLEGRIATLEKTLRNAKIIQRESGDGPLKVGLGDTVKLLDLEEDEELVFTLVGSPEANPAEARISNESPVGRAIIGKEPGTEVEVEVPAGVIRYRIVEISR